MERKLLEFYLFNERLWSMNSNNNDRFMSQRQKLVQSINRIRFLFGRLSEFLEFVEESKLVANQWPKRQTSLSLRHET